FRLLPLRPPPGAAATRRGVRGAPRPQSWYDQRRRGDPAPGALPVLGVDGDGPPEQAFTGSRGRQPHPGDGDARRAPGDPGVGAGLCTVVSDRWPQGLRHGVADPFRLLDATPTAPGQRPHTQAAVDAPTRVALRAGGEVVPTTAHRG